MWNGEEGGISQSITESHKGGNRGYTVVTAKSNPNRLIKQKNGLNKKLYFKDIMEVLATTVEGGAGVDHTIIRFEKNDSFDAKTLGKRALLENVGQYVANVLLESGSWTIKAEETTKGLEYICYKDCRGGYICDSDLFDAQEGVNKFTGVSVSFQDLMSLLVNNYATK